MNRIRLVLVAALAVAAGVCTGASPAPAASPEETWREFGVLAGARDGGGLGLDIEDYRGAAHVAATVHANRTFITLDRFNLEGGGAWEPLAPALFSHSPDGDAQRPSLATGPGGVLWMSWVESRHRPGERPVQQVRLAHRSAADDSWVETAEPIEVLPEGVQLSDDESFDIEGVDLVFHGGRPHVLVRWYLTSREYELSVYRLAADGSCWEELARPPQSRPFDASLASSGGALYLRVFDFPTTSTLLRLDGAQWTELPDAGRPDDLLLGDLTSIGGVLYGTWGPRTSGDSRKDLRVMRHDGNGWVPVGGSVGAGVGGTVREIGGVIYVAWVADADVSIYVSWLSPDGSWQLTPGPLNGSPLAHGPVLEGINGVPYVVWSEQAGFQTQVHAATLGAPKGPPGHSPEDPPPGEPSTRPPCGFAAMGTPQADDLIGDEHRNTIFGRTGDDTIRGLGQADCLFGGPGADRLKGGDGADELRGGPGRDVLTGGDGYDRVKGGGGDDVIDARGRGFDRVDCGPGRDRVLAGTADRLRNCESISYVD